MSLKQLWDLGHGVTRSVTHQAQKVYTKNYTHTMPKQIQTTCMLSFHDHSKEVPKNRPKNNLKNMRKIHNACQDVLQSHV